MTLTRLEFYSVPIEYRDDCQRICRVGEARGYEVSMQAALQAWEAHSEGLAAGWIMLPEDDHELWCDVIRHLCKV